MTTPAQISDGNVRPAPLDLLALPSPAPARLFSLACSMFLIGTMEVIAGPMMTQMAKHYGVPVARIAWLPGTYALVYTICAPLLGPLSDRFGRKALLIPALIGYGLAALVIVVSLSFGVGVLVSGLAGLCAAAIQPNTLAIINDTVDEAEQPRATGFVFMGLTLSFVVVPTLSGLLAARVDWRLPYLLAALGAFLTSALIARLAVGRPAGDREPFTKAFPAALALPGVGRRLAASYLWLGLAIGVNAILAEVLRRRLNVSAEAAGAMVGALGVVILVGNSLVSRAEQLLRSRPRIVLAGIVATSVGLLVIGVVPVVSVAFVAVAGVLWALGYGIAGPVHHFSLASTSARLRGTVVALHAALLNLGIVTVAFGAGKFLDALGTAVIVGAAVVGGVIALLLLLPFAEAPSE